MYTLHPGLGISGSLLSLNDDLGAHVTFDLRLGNVYVCVPHRD